MRVLVLGSEGQIGSALCSHLEQHGHEVMRHDISLQRDLHDLSRPEYSMNGLVRMLEWADFAFMLAFDVGGSTYLAKHQHTTEFLSNNVRIMETFCEAYKSVDSKPDFVFASSQMSNMLHSSYGVLKRLGEFYTSALGGINVRFWNVYGNEHDPDKFHVVTDFLNAAKAGGPIRMRTDGLEQRQMLHADDCAEALEALMLNAPNLDREKYFDITSFEWVTIREIGGFIAMAYAVNCLPGEKTDDVQLDTRNEPTDEILKYWHPEITLEEGIMRVADAMDGKVKV
jgi:nucleoside-diphosphate-sugar epimerase